MGEESKVSWARSVSSRMNILRHCFVFWVAMHGKLPVLARVATWSHQEDTKCPLCDSVDETMVHLFMECNHSLSIRKGLGSRALAAEGLQLQDWVRRLQNGHYPKWKQWVHNAAMAAFIYHVWADKNTKKKTGIVKDSEVVLKNIKTQLANRATGLFGGDDNPAHKRVEHAEVDRKASVVAVKASKTVEASELGETIQKKSGRKVQIISPLPKANLNPQQPDQLLQQHQKDQPPPVTTVTLQVYMHCEACAQILRKRIQKIKGIESVETDLGKDQVIVKGVIDDPSTLVKQVYKRTGKRASILVEADEEKNQDSETSSKQVINEAGSGKQHLDTKVADKTAITGEPMGRYEYYWPPTRNNYNMDYYNYLVNYHRPQHDSDENPAEACSII